MFWNKVRQCFSTSNESKSTDTEEETVEETNTATGEKEKAGENVEMNSASIEATKTENEDPGVNQAVNKIIEVSTHESFGAKIDTLIEEEDEWKIAIRQHYDFLVDRMSTDFGLLDDLLSTRCISYKEMQKIKGPRVFYKRNKICLDIILKGNKHHEFLQALETSDQIHLINYLETDGMYITNFDGNWPLTEKEIETLQSNHRILLDLLDTCDLLSRLYSTGVIDKRQRDFINWKRNPYEENEALLDILRRSSLNAYRQTIRCLHASNQSHVAEILENGGVLLRIDSRVQGEAKAVNAAEQKIAAEIANLLGNRSLPESNRIWELVQLNLVAASQGHSVALYFLCHQLSDVDRLQQMTKDGRLKEIIETVFNRLTKTSVKIQVRLKRITPDFEQCRQYLRDIKQPKSDKTISNSQLPMMSSLLFEILDSILLKSYLLHYVKKDKQSIKNKDNSTFRQLASVDCCWFQRIRKKKFKKEVWRSLVVLYGKTEKISAFNRINRQYLEENIRLHGLVNQLKSKDCLTDVETASLYKQNIALGKKDSSSKFRDEILDALKKAETVYSVFRRCLYITKQHLFREVIEKRGAVVKVELKFCEAKKTSVKARPQNLEFVERINEIRDKTKHRSHKIEELRGKLKEDDLEILSESKDGDIIVVWVWCKTKYALEKLQTLNKTKHFIDVFTKLVTIMSFSSNERNPETIKPKVNIDFEQLEETIVIKKAVVFFSILAKFTSRLELGRRENQYVEGVTKLRDKIHVLLDSSSARHCVILVFEDQFPFRLQKRIEIHQRIRFPFDIASIEMENSLYVLDFGNIWKIKVVNEKKMKIISWLEFRDTWPRTLSMTRDGQLLLVGRNLRIFGEGGSDMAELRLSIPLPKDILRPFRAMETSRGNFIIFHKKKEKMIEKILVVSEVSRDGKTILRRFIPKNEEQKLNPSSNLSQFAVDSLDRVFLTDFWKHRVILLDSDLQWNGILIPTEEDEKEGRQMRWPGRLLYDEEKKELIVGGEEVYIYTLNRK